MPDVSFPHPVLGNGDDVAKGSIDCSLEYMTSAEVVELRFSGLTSGNPTLDESVRRGSATWLLRIQCARTYFRRVWCVPGPTATIRIPGPDLEANVDVDVRVCTTEALGWQPEGAHPDYENLSFDVLDGEVLAVGPEWRFHVEKEFDPLKAPIASWMRIVEGEHKDGAFQVDFESDLVTIRLSRQDWKEYPGVRDRAPDVLHSSIVLPVLMQALVELQKEKNDGLTWKGRLSAVLDARNLREDQPLESAQELLSAPLGRSLRQLNVRLDGDDE
ncbi:MAG: hypothetical protein KAI24_26275 [Planctomycetes bacterium]|nr:hypothetical protein [Planctomycetota bacterium]